MCNLRSGGIVHGICGMESIQPEVLVHWNAAGRVEIVHGRRTTKGLCEHQARTVGFQDLLLIADTVVGGVLVASGLWVRSWVI